MTGSENPQSGIVGEALERLGRLSLRDLSVDALLQTVAEVAKSVLPGSPETSVTLLVKGRPTTVVATDGLAVELDERQYSDGRGPCLHAARSGELCSVGDTRTDGRWPEQERHAAELGALSTLSVPLNVDPDGPVSGALNFYARRPHAFDADSCAAAVAFSSYAAVAAGNVHAYRSARDSVENLRAALESRAVIDQAKGILMERHKRTADQAFQVLARASMTSNMKLRDVADHLVHTGELPPH